MALKYLPAYLAAKNREEISSQIKWWPGVPCLVAVLRTRRVAEELRQEQIRQKEQEKEEQLCACR